MDWLNFMGPLTWIPGVKEGIRDFGNRLMGSGEYDPASKANPYLEKAREQYLPWQERGNEAYNTSSPIYNQMAKDPAALMEQMTKGYEQSKGYQFQRDEALKAARSSAGARGVGGSTMDLMNQAKIAEQLAGEDYQNYFNNMFNIQGRGLVGLENTQQRGYGATSDIANTYGSQGSLAFKSQSQQNQALQDLIKALMKMASEAATAAAGGV